VSMIYTFNHVLTYKGVNHGHDDSISEDVIKDVNNGHNDSISEDVIKGVNHGHDDGISEDVIKDINPRPHLYCHRVHDLHL
jgi:hypothetical protein